MGRWYPLGPIRIGDRSWWPALGVLVGVVG
jgi:hypothetical protein